MVEKINEVNAEVCNTGVAVDCVSQVSNDQNDLNHCVPMKKCSKFLMNEDNDDSRDFDVKECTNEHLVNATFSTGSSDEDIISSDDGNCLIENLKAPKKPEKKRNSLSNQARKPLRVSACKHSVPQITCQHTHDKSRNMSVSDTCDKGYARALHSNVLKQNQCFSQQKNQVQPNNHKNITKDNACQVTSRTPMSKLRTTVATAPSFRSSERALKRKEFNAKLEEKHQALEEERTRSEARTKEEMDAAIKDLRKNLTFKANPLPSFYIVGLPPKSDLKTPKVNLQ